MADYLVTNVTKATETLERIQLLSGPGWGPYEVAAVVALIKTGTTFHTIGVNGSHVPLEIVHATPPYVRTQVTFTRADNLLSLPPCPSSTGVLGLAAALTARR